MSKVIFMYFGKITHIFIFSLHLFYHLCLRLHLIYLLLSMDIREPKNILVFSYGHVSSYCSICTRYIEFSCSSSKRNENDITKRKHIKQTTTTTITSIGQELSLQNNPYLPCFIVVCNNQKDFILWMRRINLIGYTNLFRI